MKYLFIINPQAGKENSEGELLEALKNRKDIDYEIYYTKCAKDAISYIDEREKNSEEKTCYVAVGGDGTLNEVINGVVKSENAIFTCWPCGSGNDFVKFFGGAERFLNLDNLLNGEVIDIDGLKVNEYYGVNVINVGFEAAVVHTMNKVRRKPLIGGNNAYTSGIVASLFTSTINKCQIVVDGKDINPDKKYLLCSFSNGSYCGGGYKSGPRSKIDDGLIEVGLAKPMSVFSFAKLIGYYKDGTHLDLGNEKIVYCQGKKIELTNDEPFILCVDGELYQDTHFVIEILPKKLHLLLPGK